MGSCCCGGQSYDSPDKQKPLLSEQPIAEQDDQANRSLSQLSEAGVPTVNNPGSSKNRIRLRWLSDLRRRTTRGRGNGSNIDRNSDNLQRSQTRGFGSRILSRLRRPAESRIISSGADEDSRTRTGRFTAFFRRNRRGAASNAEPEETEHVEMSETEMVPQDTHPEGQPITAKEQMLLGEVRSKVQAMEGGDEIISSGCFVVQLDANATSLDRLHHELLMRMLRGVIENNPAFANDRTKVVDATTAIIHRVMGWRLKNNMDTVLHKVMANHAAFHKYWPSMVCGCDDQGHVIQVEKISEIDADALVKMVNQGVTIEEVVLMRAQTLEMLDFFKRDLGKQRGRVRYNHICIVDLQGFSFSLMSSKVQAVLQPILQCGSDYCADSLQKIFLVNAPFSFRAAWAVISPWLHPVVRSKVDIVGGKSSYKSAFTKAGIPNESLPAFLQQPRLPDSEQCLKYLGALIEAEAKKHGPK